MSKVAYLTRREGRYYAQIRNSNFLKNVLLKDLFRSSLQTFVYSEAKMRLSNLLFWYHRVQQTRSEMQLSREINSIIQLYLSDKRDISPADFYARQRFAQWLNASPISEIYIKYEMRAMSILDNYNAKYSGNNYSEFFAIGSLCDKNITSSSVQANFKRFSAPSSNTELVADEQKITQSLPGGLRLSEALALFDTDMLLNKKSISSRKDTRLVIEFAIEAFRDPYVSNWSDEEISTFDKMLIEIPNREGIPRPHNQTLMARYEYAKAEGWDGLHRLTEKRIREGYHVCIHRFFDWLIFHGHFKRVRPMFKEVSVENLASIERDAFSKDEVLRILSQPLFTGCESPKRIWVKGDNFVQNHLYWAYLIALFTGVRPGELGRLEVSDFAERDGQWFLNIRGFDAATGRVALKDVRAFKTKNSTRIIPLPSLIIELGFLERLSKLKAISCKVVFPEWEPYLPVGGTAQWGRPITKSWSYLAKKLGLGRKDISLYSTRHWYAHMIDNTDLSHLGRKMVMGHADKSDMSARYGSKTGLSSRDLKILSDVTNPEIEEIRDVLLKAKLNADRGILDRVEQFQNRASWSDYYRNRVG